MMALQRTQVSAFGFDPETGRLCFPSESRQSLLGRVDSSKTPGHRVDRYEEWASGPTSSIKLSFSENSSIGRRSYHSANHRPIKSTCFIKYSFIATRIW